MMSRTHDRTKYDVSVDHAPPAGSTRSGLGPPHGRYKTTQTSRRRRCQADRLFLLHQGVHDVTHQLHAESRKFNRRLIQRKGPSDGSRACRCPRLPWPYSRAPAGACARSCAWLSMLSSSLALVISGRRPLRFEAMRACPPHMPEATSISCLLDVVDTGVAAFMPRRSSDSKRFDQVRLRV